jgi:hypothetical protein
MDLKVFYVQWHAQVSCCRLEGDEARVNKDFELHRGFAGTSEAAVPTLWQAERKALSLPEQNVRFCPFLLPYPVSRV